MRAKYLRMNVVVNVDVDGGVDVVGAR